MEVDTSRSNPTEGRAVTLRGAVAVDHDVPQTAFGVRATLRAKNPGLGLGAVLSAPLSTTDLETLVSSSARGISDDQSGGGSGSGRWGRRGRWDGDASLRAHFHTTLRDGASSPVRTLNLQLRVARSI